MPSDTSRDFRYDILFESVHPDPLKAILWIYVTMFSEG